MSAPLPRFSGLAVSALRRAFGHDAPAGATCPNRFRGNPTHERAAVRAGLATVSDDGRSLVLTELGAQAFALHNLFADLHVVAHDRVWAIRKGRTDRAGQWCAVDTRGTFVLAPTCAAVLAILSRPTLQVAS